MSKSPIFSFLPSNKSEVGCLPVPVTRRTCTTAAVKFYRYLRKLFNFNQMDFEFACWQMMYLFVNPQKVYRNFQYRNETKSQFARDDPAFLVLLSLVLLISSIGFTIFLKLGITAFLKLFLYFMFVDCVGIGILVATVLWFITNKYMIKSTWRGYNVEWGYAFDVHLNAFSPLVVISHVSVLFIYHIFSTQEQFVSRLLANSVWMVAICFYFYITFLGYKYLPFLRATETLLLPIGVFFVVYLTSLIIGWNINSSVINFYRSVVL